MNLPRLASPYDKREVNRGILFSSSDFMNSIQGISKIIIAERYVRKRQKIEIQFSNYFSPGHG
jgi:hypothetical protein